jgi:hypothetical protein
MKISSSIPEISASLNQDVQPFYGDHTPRPEELSTGYRYPQSPPRFLTTSRGKHDFINASMPDVHLRCIDPCIDNLVPQVATHGNHGMRFLEYLLNLQSPSRILRQQQDIGPTDDNDCRHSDHFG